MTYRKCAVLDQHTVTSPGIVLRSCLFTEKELTKSSRVKMTCLLSSCVQLREGVGPGLGKGCRSLKPSSVPG